jgi:hypothetical protein
MSTSTDEELKHALRVLRLLARAGHDALADDAVSSALIPFYADHADAVEKKKGNIEFETTTWTVGEKERQARKFFPLAVAKKKHVLISLARVLFFIDNRSSRVDLINFFRNDPKKPIGYRFETGHRGDSDTHGYLHMQMSDEFPKKRGIVELPRLPSPLRKDCPAPPLSNTVPYAGLYCALIALAGHSKDGKTGVLEALRQAQSLFKGSDFDAFLMRTEVVLERLVRS